MRAKSPDPSTFPDQPRWATWIAGRDPQFKLHNTLGMCKNALSGRRMRGGQSRGSGSAYETQLEGGYVYEYVYDPELGDGSWVERWQVPEGAYKSDMTLWKSPSPSTRPINPVPQKTVDAAIASIMESAIKE